TALSTAALKKPSTAHAESTWPTSQSANPTLTGLLRTSTRAQRPGRRWKAAAGPAPDASGRREAASAMASVATYGTPMGGTGAAGEPTDHRSPARRGRTALSCQQDRSLMTADSS